MKKISILLFGILLIISGCGMEGADTSQKYATRNMMREAHSQIGMPAIKNFQERKLAKMIFELRDKENLICYAYIVAKMTGKLIFFGKCLGFGLPYSVQYTNPEKRIAGSYTIPQADPNGLFMPAGLSATWLMMIDNVTGKSRPVYIEPEIIVSPFRLH